MNADTHKKNKIVENIQKLMSKEIDREQKIQLAFMLGRIKCDQNDKQCKVKAQNILKTEWEREFIKEQDEIYIRTLGISLISLGYNCHENDFYKHLINKKEASKINRNFHIQYFLKEGWHLDLTNDKDCTSGDIDYLWWRLRASIFNKKGKKEYHNINIISILNLSLYKYNGNCFSFLKHILKITISIQFSSVT